MAPPEADQLRDERRVDADAAEDALGLEAAPEAVVLSGAARAAYVAREARGSRDESARRARAPFSEVLKISEG